MKKEYDFSTAKRGAVLPQPGKTRITIYLDDAVIERFKGISESTGKGYQTLINETLRAQLGIDEQPLTPEVVRQVIREELAQYQAAGANPALHRTPSSAASRRVRRR